ncbi:unnamed protein product [Coregonus sp. 'balchen']|nr:unnamed protein product [Coregonus sp. 'balchen']
MENSTHFTIVRLSAYGDIGQMKYFYIAVCVNGLYGTVGFYPKFLLDLQSDVQVISYDCKGLCKVS